jgi:selenocysteine-specific elongation factor
VKPLILGTAGHIDHGKTSLVKALTGIDTDRLKEEKARGITIELGFASLTLPSGQKVGVVDVPGHEKFVKNMVAGATGIDVVALVIAADEGVMPQTREHLDICRLLNVRSGLVALTKVDMVDEDWLDLVVDDLAAFLEGSFLETAPVIPVSSVTGQGIDDFIKALDQICSTIPARSSSGLFRLPVDRVFTMKGFGTVITGTLAAGKVNVGDSVEVYPTGVKSKVRGLQVHNDSVLEASVGQRVAINFQGMDKDEVDRGQVVAFPGTLIPSYMLDVSVNLLPTVVRPLKDGAKVRFHVGTSEVMGKIVLGEKDRLEPGESAIAQIRTDAPVAAVRDDRFVLRSYSPVATIGGGFVINPLARKHKKNRPQEVEALKEMALAPPAELAGLCVESAGFSGASLAELLIMTNLSTKKLEEATGKLLSARVLVLADKESRTFIHSQVLEKLTQKAKEHLAAYHSANPLKPGMPKEELKSKFGSALSPKIFNLLLETMSSAGLVALERDILRLSGHSVRLEEDQEQISKKMLEAFAKAGLAPPTVKQLAQDLEMTEKKALEMLNHLAGQGSLVKVKQDLYFDSAEINNLKERLTNHLKEHGEITPPQFKDMTGLSRKYLIPLLEWFDSAKITIRVGDSRKLRQA